MGKRVVACKKGRFAKQNSRDIFQMAVLLADPQVDGLTTYCKANISRLSINEEVKPVSILT